MFSHKFAECVIRIKNGLIRCHWCYGHIYVGVSDRNIIGVLIFVVLVDHQHA